MHNILCALLRAFLKIQLSRSNKDDLFSQFLVAKALEIHPRYVTFMVIFSNISWAGSSVHDMIYELHYSRLFSCSEVSSSKLLKPTSCSLPVHCFWVFQATTTALVTNFPNYL